MLRVFNVSGQVLLTDTKNQSNLKLRPGGTIDLNDYSEIGNMMSGQIAAKQLKVKKVRKGVPAPTSHPEPKEQDSKAAQAEFRRSHSMTGGQAAGPAAEKSTPPADDETPTPKKGIVAKAKTALGLGKKDDPKVTVSVTSLENLAATDISNDDFIKAVMLKMIADDNNLGRDGKPNQPVLEATVTELRPKIPHVRASRRDRLFEEIKKKEADSGEGQ